MIPWDDVEEPREKAPAGLALKRDCPKAKAPHGVEKQKDVKCAVGVWRILH